QKISKSLKGRKRPQHVLDSLDKGMREYWGKEENREKQRKTRSEYLKGYQYNNKTILESRFGDLLGSIGVDFIFQHTICGFNFDYYLPKYDLVIEVDGDFYHCNPIKYPNGPIYETQRNTVKNDNKKNKICESSEGLTLLRFWETDINNKPEWVIEELKKHLK
ncbi:MAG: hypothetical protein ACXACY_15345, partial [Candidatus Hodarchaeales archaeon]